MVTTVQNSNTIAFPKPAAAKTRLINADQDAFMRLQLSSVLQTSLDLSQVLQLFFDEVQQTLPLGSMSYRNEKIGDDIELGNSARHSCHYKLVTRDDSLGELFFTRKKRFAEQELQLLEMLIGCLICPIRNALMYREAVECSLKDPLTGAGNRNALETTLKREVSIAARHNQPLSMLMVDLDHFKKINDTHGHSAGDCILKDVANQLQACCRGADASYRYGGEEFVVILNQTNKKGAMITAERIRSQLEKMASSYNEQTIDITASIGVACLQADDTMTSIFDRADKALYKAKSSGRNQVVFAGGQE
jgi:diguanylate cyclase (GGDEF)-like protein